jgi:3-oxoadipate enol-lactonase
MRIIANNLAVEYDLSGPADAPVVTLSHALATNMAMWAPQVTALESRYRVLRYDTRGHGRSRVPDGPYTLPELVEDVRALLDGLGVQQTHFVGLSLGGMIGQWLAFTYPERLHSLVLCDTSGRTAPEAGDMWDERIAIAAGEGMAPHVETTIDRWFTPGFVKEHPEIVDPVRAMIRCTDPRGYVGCAHAVKTHDALDRLPEIMVPTLIVVGEQDPGAPVGVAEVMHELIPGSELVVLESASHLSNLEQAEAFNQVLLAFVARTA